MVPSQHPIAAVRVAKDCKIPTVPGSDKIIESPEEAITVAKKLGYPVIIKGRSGAVVLEGPPVRQILRP